MDAAPQSLWRRLLHAPATHLLALWALAVTQPVFDLLGRTPQLLSAHDLSPIGVWLLVGTLYLGLPFLLTLVAEVSGKIAGRRVRERVYALLIALVATLLLQLILAKTSWPAWTQLAVAVLGGTLFALLYRRRDEVRQLLGILAPLTLLVPVLFLLSLPRQLVFGGGAGEQERYAVENPVPVVFVLFDELPTVSLLDERGRIDADLFPNFARLAARSTWFRHATAVASGTEYAVPAILTGRYPGEAKLPTHNDHPRNLFSLLDGTYDLRVFERRTRLCPDCEAPDTAASGLASDLGLVYLHLLLPGELKRELPPITTDWRSFGRLEDKAQDFQAFIDAIEPVERPTLFFAHVLLPHSPWIYLPSGKRYDPGRSYIDGLDPAAGRWIDDEWAVIQAWQRHLLQLRFADRKLGALLDKLERTGLFDQAVLVVLADHGISFQRGAPPRAVSAENYHDVMPVPLFIKLPASLGGLEPGVETASVETVDVVPTLAEALGVESGWSFDGRSLLGDLPPRDRWIYNAPGDHQWVQDPTLPRQLDTLRRKLALFGSADDPSTLFRIGPFREELWGRPLAVATGNGAWNAVIDQQDELADLDPAATEVLPARITGRIEDLPENQRLPLALAVNGRVRALSLTRIESGWKGHFSFMVPEDALREGVNEVALFSVGRSDAGPVLERVQLGAGRRFELERDRQGTIGVVAPGGESHTLVAGRFAGQATGVWAGDHQVEVVGWAWDAARDRPADWVAAFDDGRFVYGSAPNLESSGLAGGYNLPNLDRGGFVWFLRSEEMSGEVRVFAGAEDGTAGEIAFVRRRDSDQVGPGVAASD